MDIANASMPSLLREALTPQPVPSPKADPATAALVKVLVQPPAPAMVQSAQFATQALQSSLPRPAAQTSQRLSSSEIEDAYRAVMEPDATHHAPARASAGGAGADTDQASRGFAPSQTTATDSTPKLAPALSTFSPAVASAAVLVAANANAPQPRGASIRPAGHAPRSEPAPLSLWTISIVTAIVSAVTSMIVLLLFR
ncbi:hypothetical protein EN794_050850 [Mesorhizobium sp. M00.F.Ca.ET.151.01.1.1]|nr:MAG: hypothetical protein EOS71_15535 [Mesorhizobium sp.]TGU87785.1 hypothetical protein EN794_050850 [Mesorhizobium sp. M00.F.Ca.ET.151.01.1.1]TGV09881.1 hypothetical protein EN816_29030 [Mesorhizobium sp. M8A.F.Ca.ET.173.01.1.1]TIT63539.1 MAG: hypothetical protein E5W90_25610 [Mesorhizobium sp.]TIU51890.1 MAG: hypothetical protein E5W19_02600 [Mesorhizobium sp.]